MIMTDKIVKEQGKKPEEVYLMNWIDALNWLSLYHERDKYIEHIQKQI